MKILIIEKNENIAKELNNLFTQYNFQVQNVNNFQKFVNLIEKNPPDLIIANPIFEGFSPFYFIRWLRNEKRLLIPVIVYHSKPDKDILVLAKKYKVNSFILYPFNKKDLITRVFKLLGLDEKNIKISNQPSDVNLIKKNKIVDEIKRKIEQLPPFPSVIREIEALINSKKSSASDFEDVIKKDQVITAKVLKIVNSPFFSLSRKISTISESVAYMGYDTLRSVVYSAFTSKLLSVSLPSYGYKKNELWKHSYVTACFSKDISKQFKFDKKTQEELFVGGLLHDIGKLIIGQIAKDEKIFFHKEVNENNSIIELEKKYFFMNHQETGNLISEKWNLPEIHKKIISYHHLNGENGIDKEVCIVSLANYISKQLLNLPVFKNDEMKLEITLKNLNLDENKYNFIFKSCEDSLSKIDTGIF